MLIQRFINVVQRYFDVASTLCNVVSTLFQRRCPTLYQRCATVENRRRILFHFQPRINVISTLIHNVETTLIRRWNVGWVGQFPHSFGQKARNSAETVLLHKISTPGKGWTIFAFFYVRVSFHGHWQFSRQHRKKGDHPLFLITISIRTQSFRHLFATLYVRWLPRIFYRITCNYQTVFRWDLLPLRICIWLFFYGMLASF